MVRQPLPLPTTSALFIGGLLTLVCGGCQVLPTDFSSLFSNAGEPPRPAAQVANSETPKYYIEFRSEGKKPALTAIPLTDVVYVQQALSQVGAFKKYRRMKVEVFRNLKQGGNHKIPVNYDRKTKKIDPGTDYAIHPNDRIVVTEDTSTVLDDMLESIGAASGAFSR